MSYKWPWTNYHELNLTWVLEQLKDLISKSKENVETVESYEGRLTAVETELPLVSETADAAQQTASAAATLAQTASNKADAAQDNSISALTAAGVAQQTAQQARADAAAATQAAQQAQQTAQNFDGRITQAENDASAALEASRSFENRVNAAITTANNAASVATNAQGIATDANMKSAQALDEINRQRETLEAIVDDGKAELDTAATEAIANVQAVIDTIPADYTALAKLVDKKAPVILNTASGEIASFSDGADDMLIESLLVDITPIQAGSGEPSPDNIRPIGGWTGAEIEQTGVNLWDEQWENGYFYAASSGDISYGTNATTVRSKNFVPVRPSTSYRGINNASEAPYQFLYRIAFFDDEKRFISMASGQTSPVLETPSNCRYLKFYVEKLSAYSSGISINYPATDTEYHPYTGNQISVNWEDEAGTVYGGALDVVAGELKNSIKKPNLLTLPWRYRGEVAAGLFSAILDDNYLRNSSLNSFVASNIYKFGGFVGGIALVTEDFSFALYSQPSENVLYVKDSRYTTLSAFIAAIENDDVQIVYELVEPVEYQLTPRQLKTLYAYNNIYSDAGSVSVNYPADTKIYIENKFTELQALILEN